MAILRLKDQEHLMDRLACSSDSYPSAGPGSPPEKPAAVKEEIVVLADPPPLSLYEGGDEESSSPPLQQHHRFLQNNNNNNTSNSPAAYAQLSPRDYNAAYQDWQSAVQHQQLMAANETARATSPSGGGDDGGGWAGQGSMKKKRKPVNLCIQCPVCGGPAPDHMHFGGEEFLFTYS
jgi:hypothetical protein